ncbi:MAG: hypothetical protein HPY54_08415 [Chthonomonadetes bacterium]|nr:hypothetical protein [Chthonomonadetes bacterium]
MHTKESTTVREADWRVSGEASARDAGKGRLPRWIVVALLSVLIAPIVCIWTFRSEILYRSADLASSSLPVAAVVFLLLLLLVRRFVPALGRREVLWLYAVVAATVGISTMGMVQFLVTTLVAPFWFATAGNRWEEFWAHIPAWAAPRSPEVVKGFFVGQSSLYYPQVWKAWLVPILVWTGFIGALLVAQFCLARVFYVHWSQREKLTFPMLQLPLVLTSRRSGGKPLLWAGIAVAAGVQTLNALHYMVPSVPELRVLPTEIGSRLPPPWNGIGTLYLTFYPSVIGLFALVPTGILVSCAFFFALVKGENLVAGWWGLGEAGGGGSGFPYTGEQAQGAIVAFALVVAWSARGRIGESWRNREERGWWLVFACAFGVLVGFGIALGLRVAVAVVLFAVFFLCMVSIGWLRAALGPIWNPGNDVAWWTRALVRSPMPLSEGVGLAYLRWFSFGDFRAHALPTYSEMLNLTDTVRIPRKPFLVSLGVASLLSIIASLWIALDVYYRYGAASAVTDQWRTYQGRLAFDILRSQVDGLSPQPGGSQLLAAGWGALLVVLLQMARRQFLWFPLHPGGFVMAQSGALEWMWLPIVIAGTAKSLVLRAGGLRLYEKAVPFFVGLIVGDYAVCGVLALASWLFRIPLYKPFPV